MVLRRDNKNSIKVEAVSVRHIEKILIFLMLHSQRYEIDIGRVKIYICQRQAKENVHKNV